MNRLTALVAALAALSSAAVAQTTVQTVADRMAAENAPLGVRAGSFLVIPQVDLDVRTDDNIYATTNDTRTDIITSVRPRIQASSNWSRHALNGVVQVESQKYMHHGDEDQQNLRAALDGRIDVMRDTSIGGGVSYSRDHEDRGDPDALGATQKPTAYATTVGKVGIYRGLGKVNARLDTEMRHIDYSNGYTSAGAVVNNNVRDRNEYAQTLRVGYQFDPRFEAFVKGVMDNRVYDNKTGSNRSNRGQSVVVGSTFDLSGKTTGEVFVGSISRNYSNPAQKDTNAAGWGGQVTWNATDLTSVVGSITRGIEETTLSNSSGNLATNYDVRVEHALTRKVLLKAATGMTQSHYVGTTGTQRKDDTWVAGVGADYWLGRCLKAGLSYDYTNRNSNITGGDYSRNAVMLKLTATY
jgi:hypothetical protein